MIPNALPAGLLANPRLEQWIAFEPPQRVRLRTGKVEIGQGILTALAQIAAEELDIEPARLDVAPADTRESPNEGYTAGSYSVQASGAAIRLVCAEIRQMMLDEAAERLGRTSADLRIVDGTVLDGDRATRLDYWQLADSLDLSRHASGSVPVKARSDHRTVGRSMPRIDLAAKLGGGAFIHDIAMPGMLHARILHQPWAGAELAGLSTARLQRFDVDIVREGNFVAFLSSDEDDAVAAIEAAGALAEWSGGLPPSDDAGRPAWLKDQPATTNDPGAMPAGIAEHRLKRAYSRPFLAHASIGTCCALAEFAEGLLTVWTHSQGVFPLRGDLATALGLPVQAIRVIHRQGAGCYGHNGADDAAFEAAYLALQRPAQPVRVLWTRAEELGASPLSPAMLVEMSANLDGVGRPSAWSMEIWSGPHSRRPGSGKAVRFLAAQALFPSEPSAPVEDVAEALGGGAARNALALYDIPHQRIVTHFLADLPIRTSAMRGLGALANVFAIESFMDELAEAAGIDPVDYRLSLLSDGRARVVVEAAARMADEAGPVPEGRGRGFAFSRYKNTAAFLALVAEVEIEHSVRCTRIWCAVDAGLVVNPDGAANQIEGGIVQALSWTLKEEVRFHDGRASPVSWDDYPILKFSEVPAIEIRFVGSPDDPPLGVGEAAAGPTAAAVGNALARTLGIRIRDLPFSRARLMAAMLEGGA